MSQFRLWQASIALLSLGIADAILSDKLLAQNVPNNRIIPDRTVGSQVRAIDARRARIEGGTTRGSSLFHSFQEFNIDAGKAAYFANPEAIKTIFSRVTGNNPSRILGTLGVEGNANLFFINPSGIIFGPNATLDTRGSFVASTANSIVFPNGQKFGTTNPGTPPLLTIDVPVPIGLRFEGDNSGRIYSAADLQSGQNLALVGGRIVNTGEISAPGKDITLSTVPTGIDSVVRLEGTGKYIGQATQGIGRSNVEGRDIVLEGGSIDASSTGTAGNVILNSAGDVLLNDEAVVDTRGADGGSITIDTQNLEMSGGSELLAGIGEGLGSLGAQAGNIEINAAESLKINGDANSTSNISNVVRTRGLGNAGDVIINTGTLEGTGNFGIASGTFGRGNAGKIAITATDEVSLEGLEGTIRGVLNFVQPSAIGNGGDIVINARSLSLSNNALLSTATTGTGNAGNIQVNVPTISMTNRAGLSSETFGKGRSGNLTFNTRQLLVRDGSAIAATADRGSEGDAGNLTINASELIQLSGTSTDERPRSSRLTSSTLGQGNAGELSITTKRLLVQNGAGIAAGSQGEGNAGNLTINTQQLLVRNGAGILTTTLSEGKGGNLRINASESVRLHDNGVLATGTTGTGDAGNLTVNTQQLLVRDGAVIATTAERGSEGEAGTLTINASESIQLVGTSADGQSSSRLTTATFGKGDAGNLTVNTKHLLVRDGAEIFTITNEGSEGEAGTLEIKTGQLIVRDRAGISTTTNGEGRGGKLSINASDSVSIDRVGLIFSGVGTQGKNNAGNIDIRAGSLSVTNGSLLFANTAGNGDAGDININVDKTVAISGFTRQEINGQDIFIPSAVLSTVERTGQGNGGNINIEAESISMNNVGSLINSTYDRGNAGDISITVDDSVSLSNLSFIQSNVSQGGVGKGGDISIQARSLTLTSGSHIEAGLPAARDNLPGGQGEGGTITINASDSVEISGVSTVQFPIADPSNPSRLSPTTGVSSGIFTSTQEGANGQAGDIIITTGAFRLANGAVVEAPTANSGKAGDITINANSFEATGGGQVISATRGSGNAGNITLNIRDNLSFSGSDPTFEQRFVELGSNPNLVTNQGSASGVFANTDEGSTGNGGNIFIEGNPRTATIADGATVTVSSQGQGRGGQIQVKAGSLTLDNGTLTAQIASNQIGEEVGNITLDIRDLLLLRNGSEISTNVGTSGAGGSGGNIFIDAGTIFAVSDENSDITANAFRGRGGNVVINTDNIFGIDFRERLTPLSDITASSEAGFTGNVEINTSGVEPTRGLEALTEQRINVEVSQGCQVGATGGGTIAFYNVGRGGLPSSPDDLFNSPVVQEWLPLESAANNRVELETARKIPQTEQEFSSLLLPCKN